MKSLNSLFNLFLIVLVGIALESRTIHAQQQEIASFRGVLLSEKQITPARLQEALQRSRNAIALELSGDSKANLEREIAAARKIRQAGLRLYYWIEIARNPNMAEKHPQWMASLQGHRQWRRLFKDPPQAKQGETIKNFPWVPILYKEAFDAHLERVKKMTSSLPKADGIFLNDLQGAPSACGCGNTFCRWTTDYGPVVTATKLNDDAPGRFVKAVKELLPDSQIIPVWTTECEEHDGAEDGLCAGVGCFRGICWKAYTRQLMPVAEESKHLGVLLPFREFQRDTPNYGNKAAWIQHALATFVTMPAQNRGKRIASNRLIAVLQGWNVKEREIDLQIKLSLQAGAAGYLIARSKIEQSWQPQIYRLRN